MQWKLYATIVHNLTIEVKIVVVAIIIVSRLLKFRVHEKRVEM